MKRILIIGIIALFLSTPITSSINCQNFKNKNNGMRINFYEEFPNPDNLSKAELINFPSTIYIAGRSLNEFFVYRDMLYDINPSIEAAYWPVLNDSYWISPFSQTYELQNLILDLESYNESRRLKVHLDLELPGKKYIKNNIQNLSFFKNKGLIEKIFLNAEEYNIEIYTGEYPSSSILDDFIWKILGISYSPLKFYHKKTIMFYSSFFVKKPFLKKMTGRYIVSQHNRYDDKLQVALGAIDMGRSGKGPLISPEQLDKDLKFSYDIGINTATIFRLGGLNESYINVIEKYL